MQLKIFIFILALCSYNVLYGQQGADTLHYKKVYYFAGTGIAIPLGKAKDFVSPRVFAGSMGLDISLKNPDYYIYPALYTFNFVYDQIQDDPRYEEMIKNGQMNFYMLSLAGGKRRQFERLNTYGYIGPTIGLLSEPRSDYQGEVVRIEYDRSITFGMKVGVGADYKFKGFFLGGELGYFYNATRVQGRPFQALTIMFGLKSDITRLSSRVVDIVKSKT